VHREIDDDTDIGHTRRKRADPRDGDRQDILLADRIFNRRDRRIEAFDMADHQGDVGAARRRDDGVAFLDRRGDRLLHHHMHAALDRGHCQLDVQVGRCRNGQRVDAGRQQSLDVTVARATERIGYEVALLAVGIDDAGELDPGQIGQHAGVIASHDTNAGNPDA
jgi:hypothetical protein